MKFGVSFLPDCEPHVKPAAQYFAEALLLSRLADDAGLHAVKMTEHYLQAYGGYCPSPLSFLSAVAAQTKSVRLMTGCILPAFHHPVQIAAEAAMIDAISNGRLDVGFARAYLPYEFATFGVPLDTSRSRFVDTVETVVRLWHEQRVSVSKPFFAFENANSLPPVTQSAGPPVWIAATRSRQSFAWVGEKGFGLLVTTMLTANAELREMIEIYRSSFAAAHPDKTPRVALSQPLVVDHDDRRAIANSDLYLQRYLEVWARATDSWTGVRSADYLGYSGMSWAVRSARPEQMRANASVAAGDPHRVAEHLARVREELAPDQVLWQIDFGAMPLEISQRTLTLFAQKLMSSPTALPPTPP